jgi:hypothetical protein
MSMSSSVAMNRTRAIDLSTSRDLAALTLRCATHVINIGEDWLDAVARHGHRRVPRGHRPGLFVYGDLAVHRTARIVGVVVTTVAVVVAAILASMREGEG